MNQADLPEVYHGGDLTEAERMFGRPENGGLDLSTGINPNSYPNTEVNDASLWRLPQPAQFDALLSAARAYYRVPEGVPLVAASGSQSLIQWLPALATPHPVAIIGPTYSGHIGAWMDNEY